MSKKMICALLLCITLICSGCTSILEDSIRRESPHVAATSERQPEEHIEVSSFDELRAAILEYIIQHESYGQLLVRSYVGELYEDIERAVDDIAADEPIAVYSVADIDWTVTRIVSYYEIDLTIEYKRTKEQVESIVVVSTQRYLRAELLSIMSEYLEEAVFLTSLVITEEELTDLVRETYYLNPRSIVMMPVTVVEMFAAGESNMFVELRFAYIGVESRALRQFGTSLAVSVRMNARRAEGENDAEILLCLVENLIGASNYDYATANTISEHGVQNIAATAYGALAIGNAAGEGFAMAFKALCDELGLECSVVLGYLDGMVHAWNIITLHGDNYHIDVAMCAFGGVETAFFKTDSDFSENYSWDMENTVKCNGSLSYEDIVGVEEEEDDDDDDDGDGVVDDEEGVDGSGDGGFDRDGGETGAADSSVDDESSSRGEDTD